MSSNKSSGKNSSRKTKCTKRFTPAQLLWNDIVGSKERLCIPAIRLPTNRIILQRYHTVKLALSKSTSVRSLDSKIYLEVASVWTKANVPMKTEKACIEVLVRLLGSWTTFSANSRKCQPSSDKYVKYKTMLDEVCDLAIGDEDEVRKAMSSTRLPTWERDFQFYKNQKSGLKLFLQWEN